MDWETLLITLFVYISEQYKTQLWPFCQRMSNNSNPQFRDEELLTIFIYGVMKKRFELKDIYNYTHSHLREWFPHLPSYVAFVQRLNRFDSLFPLLIELILKDFSGSDLIQQIRLIDSMPIIMANAKRSSKAKTVAEFANKGYCASKGIYYYGVKLHILAFKREKTLPLPDYIGLTPASDHDLSAFNHIAHLLREIQIYADKAYIDQIMQQLLEQEYEVQLNTPVKKKKGQKKLELFDQLLSSSISRIRQPIESLFNWIQEKTNIQIASKVRSYNGLMVHVFGKLTAAMFLLVFNP
jgi:hypothetical protein